MTSRGKLRHGGGVMGCSEPPSWALLFMANAKFSEMI
jgi:hypothetical protein